MHLRMSWCVLNQIVKRTTSSLRVSKHHGGLLSLSKRTCSTSALLQHLRARIKASGPLTVAEYMKEALTNPVAGYYINRDVFGEKGDFTTSPEISQMFGELVAIWVAHQWMEVGAKGHLQVVELGPGRGTMAKDMLLVFSQIPEVKDSVSLHLVEVSKKLSEIQEQNLSAGPIASQENAAETPNPSDERLPYYKSCISQYGPKVHWYRSLQDVPAGVSCFIAHEFFDALPIHKFQKTDAGWREVIVAMDVTNPEDSSLQFLLSPGGTAATTAYLKPDSEEKRDHIEICPEAGVIVQEISQRLQQDGGMALIADYGHDGDKTDTFRGFKNHQLYDVLKDPGSADLTADVDFSYLRKLAGSQVRTYGPIPQAKFLHFMGITVRLKILLQVVPPEARKSLISGYEMLTSPKQMGERFKFFVMLPPGDPSYMPAGFVPPQ